MWEGPAKFVWIWQGLLGGFGIIVAVSEVDFGRSIMLFDFISSVVPPLRPFLDSVVDQFVDSGNWLDYR